MKTLWLRAINRATNHRTCSITQAN